MSIRRGGGTSEGECEHAHVTAALKRCVCIYSVVSTKALYSSGNYVHTHSDAAHVLIFLAFDIQ